MYLYLMLEIVFAAIIVFILWSVLKRSGKRSNINIRDASLTCEELEDHARKIAIEHTVSKNQNTSYWPVPRMNENYMFILSVYKELNEDIRNKLPIPQAAEWLLDNFYIIEEQVKSLRRDISRDIYSRLPVLKCGQLKGYARIFAVVTELVSHTDGNIDDNIILNYLKAYQTHNVLYDREIWAIPDVLRLSVIESIRNICEKIKDTRTQWHKADDIVNNWPKEATEFDKGFKALKSRIKTLDINETSFIEHLFFRLRRGGQSYSQILKFMVKALNKKGTTAEIITQKEHNAQAQNTVSIGNCIVSLKFIANLSWVDIFESTSNIERILNEDPEGIYSQMDLISRNYYRSRIEELAEIYGDSEIHIAKEAIDLARNAQKKESAEITDPNELKQKKHVGYYLIGKGTKLLEAALGGNISPLNRVSKLVKNNPGLLYFSSIILLTAFILLIALHYSILESRNNFLLFVIPIVLIACIPASEIAINTVNWIVCKALKPTAYPRLELKNGIPPELTSVVVIPALISDEKRVRELLMNLENHYLSNKEKNVFFVLVGDFKDSKKAEEPHDSEIINTAVNGVAGLNRTYGNEYDIFYFLQRERKLNTSHNRWMGWERKRGALMEFNEFLLGSKKTSFKYFSFKEFPKVEINYIITLDADTILPIGMLKKLIGTMAHPLNKPIMDIEKNIVIDGYALMQPRISFDVESTNKTQFSRIFAGDEGLDPYASAVSDIYQDLFGEGIFTGKGIYDLKVFQKVLSGRLPENTVLSHDLLEGSFLRTALASDMELVDSYPSSYSSYADRLHRWVRGDWQLLPFLGSKIPNSRNEKTPNPLSGISRWKILDNLRRSLVAICSLLLIFGGFTVLPGSGFFWLGFSVVVIVFPLVISLIDYLISKKTSTRGIKRHVPAMSGIKAGFYQALLLFIFLPHQAYLVANAVIVTLVRVLFTKRNMLLWVTAADSEKKQKASLKSYYIKMSYSIIISFVLVVLTFIFKAGSIYICIGLFVLWSFAPMIAYMLSRPKVKEEYILSSEDETELLKIARKTYRFFEEFANIKNNFLAPDNYQEDPPRGIAHRSSPTNIGLGLLAILSARDFGFLGTSEMTELLDKSVNTIEKLEKWNGHLYNWYDTRSLRPLRPQYISTVDSGNLVCYLITLIEGLKQFLNSPLIDMRLVKGIRTTLDIYYEGSSNDYRNSSVFNLSLDEPIDIISWNNVLNELTVDSKVINLKKLPWKNKFDKMLEAFKKELSDYMPWIKEVNEMLPKIFENDQTENVTGIIKALKSNPPLSQLGDTYKKVLADINGFFKGKSVKSGEIVDLLSDIRDKLPEVISRAENLKFRLLDMIGRLQSLSENMEFKPLYVEKKQLFSIGYNIDENKLTNSYYDLLASEARQTSFIAIARGEVPVSHWFKMGRALTVFDRYKGLVSWTGTMFEYLMPLLIMRSYKNTLLDETYSFVIRCQKKYGRQRNIPWGASESGFNSLDINLDYQYKAIGVPWLGLKRGLIEDAVTTPYATFLALLVDPESAIENIYALKAEGMDGPYGYYEAVDYTPERLQFDEKKAIIKSFMAHHEGMSLLSLNNYINGFIMQERFHSNPSVKAAKLLLNEKVPSNIVLTKEEKERVMPFKDLVLKDKGTVRKFSSIDSVLPKAHILSNGNYSIMITDRGTGYSKNKLYSLTRWREDLTLDNYGMFFYIRNLTTNELWSGAYAPENIMPQKYEVKFSADKAEFKRLDGNIETRTEIVVTSGDDVEIRTLKFKNTGSTENIIEITSYFEAVIAKQASDAAHPAFSNLFVRTEYKEDRKCIIANRRPRSESEKNLWAANWVIPGNNIAGEIQFETDRMKFIGRTHNVSSPESITENRPLSNTVGPVLDPVMCLRLRIRLEPGKQSEVSFVAALNESYETLMDLVEKYNSQDSVEGAFKLALRRSQVEAGYLNMEAAEMELFQDMLSNIIFISPQRKQYDDVIRLNHKGQSSLWAFGISGDLPVILLVLKKSDELNLLYEVLKAHEYWRLKDMRVDLVILSEEENGYTHPLYALISDIITKGQNHDILNKPGGVFILDRSIIGDEELHLLYAISRIILKGEKGSLKEQMNVRQSISQVKARQFPGAAIKYEGFPLDSGELQFFNGLGGFNKEGNEYVIRLEKGQNTPAPWVNVISNPDFGFLVSESGGGYTWSENSRENKLTPWTNDPVSDNPGEIFYISDNDSGGIWTITPLPIRQEEPYIIKHGFGYTEFLHNSKGIEQSLLQFVPVNEAIKLCIIKLNNKTSIKRNLNITCYLRPVMGVSDQITAQHIRTVLTDYNVLYAENPYNEEFPGRKLFLETSENDRSITGDRKDFFGTGGLLEPDTLKRDRLSGATGSGFDPCLAMQVNIILEGNSSKEVVFILGECRKLEDVRKASAKYKKIKDAKNALAEVTKYWKDNLGSVKVNTPDNSMDIILNGWLSYQVLSCRIWARSGFYQSGGAYGFRDQLQDSLALAHISPEIPRKQILLHAMHQFLEGDVQHWWHEPTSKGTRTRFSDDLLWLPYVTSEYIRITGDRDILYSEASYLEDELLKEFEDERYGIPRRSDKTETVYEHCKKAIERGLKLGAHGLPLMGSGDWNDGMNTVGNRGLGESVWLAWFMYSILGSFGGIVRENGEDELSQSYEEARSKLLDAIEKNAWDGNWYRRAYFDNGAALGSIENTECKIDAIAQSWAVISEGGDTTRARLAMNSLDNYLIRRDEGLIKLLTPPFDSSDLEPGYIKGYVPGVRENGGQYTHAAAWVIIAFAKLGDGDRAWELFQLINPINHTRTHLEYSLYKVEPYVMAADVYSVPPHTGRGGWTWYTGSAGWILRAGLEYILGFKKTGNTLFIDPCIPGRWNEFGILYKYRETTYNIRVKNPNSVMRGVKEVFINKEKAKENSIELVNDGKEYEVEVIMGLNHDS